MIEVVHMYRVEKDADVRFTLVFGPGGAWSRFLSHCDGFRGITLLRDEHDPRRFLSIEVWDREGDRAAALAAHPTEYAEVETALLDVIESKTELGTFRLLAEGTVRSLSTARRPRRR